MNCTNNSPLASGVSLRQALKLPGEKLMAERIGFVGVGRMGANMARRLKQCGYPIAAVYDVRGKVARELARELGAEACKTVSKVTQLSDVVLTVVTDDAAMNEIFSEKGKSLLTGAK